jgi:hypothetical protein
MPSLARSTITIRNGRRIDIATGADLGPVIPDTANTDSTSNFGGNRRRLSRKYKKSKRVFRKKSRSTRRR